MCKDTFAGYVCTCGSGFISHNDPKNGKEVWWSFPMLRFCSRTFCHRTVTIPAILHQNLADVERRVSHSSAGHESLLSIDSLNNESVLLHLAPFVKFRWTWRCWRHGVPCMS